MQVLQVPVASLPQEGLVPWALHLLQAWQAAFLAPWALEQLPWVVQLLWAVQLLVVAQWQAWAWAWPLEPALPWERQLQGASLQQQEEEVEVAFQQQAVLEEQQGLPWAWLEQAPWEACLQPQVQGQFPLLLLQEEEQGLEASPGPWVASLALNRWLQQQEQQVQRALVASLQQAVK